MKPTTLLSSWLAGFVALVTSAAEANPPTTNPDAARRAGEEFFEAKVRPLLLARCAECHGNDKQEAGLRLDVRTGIEHGGDSGPVVVAGQPDASRLIKAIRYSDDTQMPPEGKLAEDEIAMLVEWVSRGAPWSEQSDRAEAEIQKPESSAQIAAAAKDHWSFRPAIPQSAPPVQNQAWVQSPLDPFILAKLEAAGFAPNPVADRRTLIRRATYDLTGLPPTLEEVDAFVNDSAPDAFGRLIDRLLASPKHGERWGRHWLDVVRYADTKGYTTSDKPRDFPYVHLYRDWVIQSLNDDMPYDQFLKHQLAADRLPTATDKNTLAALGMLRVGRHFLGNRPDQIDDCIDVVMRGTQGLTVACARCHNHKYDPIPTADYYSLYGIFDSTQDANDEELMLLAVVDKPDPHNVQIFRRGNPALRGDEAPRQFLAVLAGEQRQPFSNGSGRLELAEAIASPNNPLTARVMVNRVWAHHFGAGLVRTPSDFGTRGDPPTHPELLDDLAARFVADGWSLKKLHRLIMLSSVYQQSSGDKPACREADPENRWYWRMNRHRLEFEELRDSLLAVSGELNAPLGGEAVDITTEPFSRRRTVYAKIDRQNLPGIFRTFDFANPDTHSPQRYQTTVPQQGLLMFNHPFVLERAHGIVSRLDAEHRDNAEARVARLYELVFARPATEEERSLALEYVRASTAVNVSSNQKFDVWQQLAQGLLLTNEFLYVD